MIRGSIRAAAGVPLAAGATARITFAASTTCADQSMNIIGTRSLAPDAKPIALVLEGTDVPGLDRPFPFLHCAGPSVDVEG